MALPVLTNEELNEILIALSMQKGVLRKQHNWDAYGKCQSAEKKIVQMNSIQDTHVQPIEGWQ